MPLLPMMDLPPSLLPVQVMDSPSLLADLPAQPSDARQSDSFPVSPERILQTFLDLVRISSPSGQEEQIRAYLEQRIKQLGIPREDTLRLDRANYMVDPSGNLIIRIPSNTGSSRTLLMDAHMDVVPPCLNVRPIIKIDPNIPGESRVVYSSGDTVLGGDDKSALAPMLEILAVALQTNQPRPNLIITWTVKEELGAIGVAEIDPRWYAEGAYRADLALSFDINGPQGTVVNQSAQLKLWDATFHGKSAHAGIEPEKGISALKAAVLAAAAIPVGRLDSETSVNIGKIQSGEKFNIVPDRAELSGEVRSFNPRRVDEEFSHIQQAVRRGVEQVPGTTFEWRDRTVSPPYRPDLDQPLFEPLKKALLQTGLTLNPIRTAGGSDANVFATKGIPSIALSGAYYNPHQITEYVKVKDMAIEAELILNIWRAYADE